jgi:hypothetical protein
MIVIEGTVRCGVCKTGLAVVYCDGCERPLCKDCREFDIWCYGCGHADTKAFCNTCKADIAINPWSGDVPE